MAEIVLQRANVVKSVDSEDKAAALEAKGFIRTDGKTAPAASSNKEVQELKTQLAKAGEVLKAADERRGELEKELADIKEKLQEASEYAKSADKKIEELTQELAGTKEQLEAAVKKNKAADKK